MHTEPGNDDLVPRIRKEQAAFPAEHMRVIGEICVMWAAMEDAALQAICESASISQYEGLYLGSSIPAGVRFDMLHAIANTLKEVPNGGKKIGEEMIRLLQKVRDAYALRNKYAHARIRTNGPDKDPELHVSRVTKRLDIDRRPLPLSELKADADAIFEACDAFMSFLQQRGICRTAWP